MRFMVRASLACVPALSQMKVGDQPRRAIARASGAQSGPFQRQQGNQADRLQSI